MVPKAAQFAALRSLTLMALPLFFPFLSSRTHVAQ